MSQTFGWFGQPEILLSGVFLLPLGLPWILSVVVVPEIAKPFFTASAPLVNFMVLVFLCRKKQAAIELEH
jgi:hypothetical protein